MAHSTTKYFLGETSAAGYKTAFDQQIKSDDFFTYILKGGPGTGKSEIIKNIALRFADKDEFEIYSNAIDPCSPDAILFKKAKVILTDGSCPHSFEPTYPGAFQTLVNLDDCWNRTLLDAEKQQIKKLSDENSTWLSRCRRYLTAFSSLNSDIYSIAKAAINFEKLDGFIFRMLKKHFPKTGSSAGKIIYKKKSALTKNGYVTLPAEEYDSIIPLNDPCFAGSDYFLQQTADLAVARGYTVLVSQCIHFNETVFEHILIPEIKLAFLSVNGINELEFSEPAVNFMRFYDKTLLNSKKNRMDFSRKAAAELQSEAVSSLNSAQKSYAALKALYSSALEKEKWQTVYEKLEAEIAQRYPSSES